MLYGTSDDSQGIISFSLINDARSLLEDPSDPTEEVIIDVVTNPDKHDPNAPGTDFIRTVNGHRGGSDIERTANMAVLGGTMQATLMAVQSTSDALEQRMGTEQLVPNLITASNGQGSNLWLNPIYVSHDSDGFATQHSSYGAEIDLYGLSLGADYTHASGWRFGAMFNLGQGDSDGQGLGEHISNDFDYFGGSLYAGKTWSNFTLSGAVSYKF